MSQKLLTKKITFQGKQITMYSIDGVTWSTRADELYTILERHVHEQAGFGADLKGEEKVKSPLPKPKPKKFTKVHDDGELDDIIDDDLKDDEEIVVPEELEVDIEDVKIEKPKLPNNRQPALNADKGIHSKKPKPLKKLEVKKTPKIQRKEIRPSKLPAKVEKAVPAKSKKAPLLKTKVKKKK